jgi:hypothetical protein
LHDKKEVIVMIRFVKAVVLSSVVAGGALFADAPQAQAGWGISFYGGGPGYYSPYYGGGWGGGYGYRSYYPSYGYGGYSPYRSYYGGGYGHHHHRCW